MLIILRIDEQNAQYGNKLGITEPKIKHVSLVLEKHELLICLVVYLHDDCRAEIVIKELPDLRDGCQVAKRHLLDKQNDKEVSCFCNIEVL